MDQWSSDLFGHRVTFLYRNGSDDVEAINAISAVNARGGFWYRTFTGSLNASRFLGFLKDLLRARRRRLRYR